MGLIQCYAVRAFRDNDTRIAGIADHMARNRFQKLMSHVHFVNNLEVNEEEKTDKLWRLRPWLDSLQNSLKKLPQEEHSSVDEVMVPFKGRSSVKQYMRNKPHKWGFKLWGRAGASGTLYEFDVYQGASGQQSKPGQLSKTSEVVLSMTHNVPDGQNFKLFADNLFTSLNLVKRLKYRGSYYVGTVRMNRLKECQLSSEKEMKQAGRGAVDSLVETKSGCVVVRWFDNRTVDLLSSYIGPESLTKVKRYDKRQKSMISVECPAVVIEYNKFMGGIDLHDSLSAFYRYYTKSRRWYMYIFFYTLNMMVVNAWLRYRHHARLLKISSMKLSKFQVMLSNQLIKPSKVGRPSLGNTPPAPKHVYRRKIPAPGLRLDHVRHLPEIRAKRGRCKHIDIEVDSATYHLSLHSCSIGNKGKEFIQHFPY